MSNPALFVGNDKCDMILVNFIEISQLEWISFHTNVRDSIELFVILKTGPILNTVATKIVKYDIYGDVYFVKLYQGKWVSVDYSDIPGAIDILMEKMEKMTMGTSVPKIKQESESNEDQNTCVHTDMQDDCEYYDPESLWDDGWNDGWRTPDPYDSC
jgi:hypothetical protein